MGRVLWRAGCGVVQVVSGARVLGDLFSIIYLLDLLWGACYLHPAHFGMRLNRGPRGIGCEETEGHPATDASSAGSGKERIGRRNQTRLWHVCNVNMQYMTNGANQA